MKAILYFTAEWCTPCKQTLPMVENFIKENKDIGLVVIDVEKDPDILKEFNIFTIPTMVLFENEEYSRRISGSLDKESFKKFIYGE